MLKSVSFLLFVNAVIFLLLDFDILKIEFINNSIATNWKSTISLISLVLGVTLFKIAQIKKTSKV
ncbi:hypothetical protein [Viridibacillus arvi]|uniref:hypothetical protein n=1 Tax=Viridibacillus arvi TaxID=263475 RepID=UPI00187B88F9|nr:hypothetical protein [Viridibacillus sp. JNUCC-6]QOV12588.1 hypothetical protein JNUCC6_07490 [Viridibacillus sp. JNUCC-6]